MWMIENADELRTVAQQRRNRGLHTGKAAKGWNVKRPDPEKGSFDRLRLEIKARLRQHWSDVLEDYARVAFPERFEEIPF
jgi:hypothetical protein